MDDNLANFLILAVAIISTILLIVSTSWLRHRLRQAEAAGNGGAERVALLSDENEALRGQVGQLKGRLEVLERIATDPATRTAHEIEQLR